MPEGALQPEVLWGSREEEKFAASNILTDPSDFSNSTHANYWLAKEREVEGQGFVVRVGNSKRKIVGVQIRNTYNTSEGYWATRRFKLEGSLLKEPETPAQRSKENTAHWWTTTALWQSW